MPYQQVTLATLQQDLKDKWESVPFWTDAQATSYLNESLRCWNMLTGQWKRRETIVTVANQVWYALTSTMVYNMRVDFSNFPLEISSVQDLDNGRPNWEGERTNSGGSVPTRPTIWAPAGLKLLAIWPADAVGGTTLVIDSVRQTPVLAAAGDFVDLGQTEHGAILGYALHIATFKIGGARHEATKSFYRSFLAAAGDLNSRLRASTFYRKAMGQDVGRFQRPIRVSPPQEPA